MLYTIIVKNEDGMLIDEYTIEANDATEALTTYLINEQPTLAIGDRITIK